MPFRDIESKADWDTLLRTCTRLVVVDFHASWCGPCHAIAPHFALLSERYGGANGRATFVRVDVDAVPDVWELQHAKAVPTFAFFYFGSRLHAFSGADKAVLEAKIQEFVANLPSNDEAAKAAADAAAAAAAPAAGAGAAAAGAGAAVGAAAGAGAGVVAVGRRGIPPAPKSAEAFAEMRPYAAVAAGVIDGGVACLWGWIAGKIVSRPMPSAGYWALFGGVGVASCAANYWASGAVHRKRVQHPHLWDHEVGAFYVPAAVNFGVAATVISLHVNGLIK